MRTRKNITPVVPVLTVYHLPMMTAIPPPNESFYIIVDSLPDLVGSNIIAECDNPDLNGRNDWVVRVPQRYYFGWTLTSVPNKYAIYAALNPNWIQKSRQQAVRKAAKIHYQQLADLL